MQSAVLEYWPIAAVVGGLILVLLLSLKRLGASGPPYVRRQALVTDGELVFYHVLRSAVADDWAVCAMVRLADLIQVRPQTPDHLAWRNRILCKHIDFVLCEHDTLEICLAIELDDRSHDRRNRQERDAFVDSALEAAGIPLLRIKAAASYDADELRESIEDSVGAGVAHS